MYVRCFAKEKSNLTSLLNKQSIIKICFHMISTSLKNEGIYESKCQMLLIQTESTTANTIHVVEFKIQCAIFSVRVIYCVMLVCIRCRENWKQKRVFNAIVIVIAIRQIIFEGYDCSIGFQGEMCNFVTLHTNIKMIRNHIFSLHFSDSIEYCSQ